MRLRKATASAITLIRRNRHLMKTRLHLLEGRETFYWGAVVRGTRVELVRDHPWRQKITRNG